MKSELRCGLTCELTKSTHVSLNSEKFNENEKCYFQKQNLRQKMKMRRTFRFIRMDNIIIGNNRQHNHKKDINNWLASSRTLKFAVDAKVCSILFRY